MRPDLEAALATDGVLRVSRGTLARHASAACAAGELVRVLPGVYARDNAWRTRCVAALRADPTAVIAGRAAAALTWWPELAVEVVDVHREARPQPGYRWLRGSVPSELIVRRQAFRVTSPALTALDLVSDLGGVALDRALRTGKVKLVDLERALELTSGRPGNALRRWLVDDSRDEPWSELERAYHRGLRGLDLPWRYRTNHVVILEDDERAALDCALPALLLAFEFDGYAYHGGRLAFERDRRRDAQLTQLGWLVVRLGEDAVAAEWFGRRVRGIVATRARQLGVPFPASTTSRQITLMAAAQRGFSERPDLA